MQKFESMYQLGVRAFAVFFDDISGEGTRAEKQAELLNYLDDNFVAKKGDVAPLLMCPTEYNKSWANIERGYLPTLGDKLNKDVEIMWTGNTVVATIDKPDMQWINGHIKRKGYIWFNFPVSDFVRDHLLLGEVYGNSLDIADDVSGFLSNPMERAEASKIALYAIADYTWNMKNYDRHAAWLRGIADLMPEERSELELFARHSSALGQNGHRFDREESILLRPMLERIKADVQDREAIQVVYEECRALSRATDILIASKYNPNLIREIKPWLRQAKLIAEYGRLVLKVSGQSSTFLEDYKHAQSLLKQMYQIDSEANQNPYQPGVKYGSQILLPTLNELLAHHTKEYNDRTGASLSTTMVYIPFRLVSDVPQLANQSVTSRGNQVNVSPSNEVIRWGAKQSLQLIADEPLQVTELSLDLGTKDIAKDLQLEVKVGDTWQTLALSQGKDRTGISANVSTLSGKRISALRLKHTSAYERELRLRSFRLVVR